MKTIMKKLKGLVSKVKVTLSGVKTAVKNYLFVARAKAVLSGCRGEGFIDSGVSILIAVVIGALLLGGLYALFGDTILPTLTQKIQDLFNYAG